MAITSPFRKHSHSRDGSRDDPSVPTGYGSRPQQLQGAPYSRTQHPSSQPGTRVSSGRNGPPPVQQLKKSNTSASHASTSSTASTSLAQQYESDKQRLLKYCFCAMDSDGVLVDNYITHVRIIEDAAYPSAKPPSSSPASNKKPRILALAVKKDGTVFLHKGRENANGSFQIGRTWSLNELSKIEREPASEAGFLCTLGKDYYWETNSSRERQVFITSFVRIYRKFKNGMVPELVNWDLSLFGLDENSYKLSLNREIRKASVVSVDSSKGRASSTQSPMVPAVQSPRVVEQPPSPKKVTQKPSIAPSSIAATAASLASSRQPTAMNTGPQPKRPSVSDMPSTRRPSASKSSASGRPSLPASENRRPSVSGSSRVNQQPVSKENIIPPSVQITEEPPVLAQVETTKPLSLGSSSASSKKTIAEREILKQELAPFDLDMEISEQMKSLGLDSPVEIVPKPKETPKTADSVSDSSSSQHTNALSVSQTIKSVEIVAHRRSLLEFEEEEYSSDDDITALYQDSSDQLDSSVIHHNKEVSEVIEPVPFPTSSSIPDANDSQEFSYENSYDEMEASTEIINATPRAVVTETPTTIKANILSDTEDDYDDLNASPIDGLQVPQNGKRRLRANTIESVMETQDPDHLTFDDIFDEINWDTNDDSESLTLKLMKELADTEYETTKQLIEVRGQSSELKQQTIKISQECNKLTPLLNLFTVELSGFSRDIQHIENEGQGLQVETINKKILWNDLQTLLNTVAVDEGTLDVLLSGDIDRDLIRLEPVLAELESAINAIRGDEKGEEDLGNMRVLRERRSKYESVISQFLRRMRIELEKRFGYALNSLAPTSSQKDILRSVSPLLVYSGITLFIKDMADDAFYDIVGCWEAYAGPLYESILAHINTHIVEKTLKSQKFTFSSATAFKQAIPSSVMKKVNTDLKQNRLREKFGLSEPSSPIDQPSSSSDTNEIDPYFDALQTVLNHVILQQDFLVKFFHMTSGVPDVGQYIQKCPIDSRQALLNSSIGDIDFHRGNARDISSSIGAIFQAPLDTLQKSVIQSLRSNQKNTPGVMLWIELFEKQFGSSDQEYLLGQFKKLSDRLTVDWSKFVGIEKKTIEKTILTHRHSREVSIIIQNFCSLVKETEKTFAKTLAEYPVGGVIVKNLETGKKMDATYNELASSILENLKQEFEEKFSRFKIHEGSENQDKMNYLINIVQNSNWVIESLTPLKLPSLSGVLSQYQSVYKTSCDQFVNLTVNQHFGKVMNFVADVDGLLQETAPKSVDPSKRNAYNKSVLSKILANYTTRDVTKIIHDIREDLAHHLDDMSESDIQRLLLDKMWSAIQAHFVSIIVRLESIMDKYYRDTELKFTRKDVIAAFNASRMTH